MPISLARCEACAVERLMKLIQPNTKINTAITNKPYRVFLLAILLISKLPYFSSKCRSLNFCKLKPDELPLSSGLGGLYFFNNVFNCFSIFADDDFGDSLIKSWDADVVLPQPAGI